MIKVTQFKRGDLVIHPRRPEWGEGVVDQATSISHEGRTAQRLIVRFINHGRVTINTAVAPLVSKGVFDSMSTTRTPSPPVRVKPQGWLESLAKQKRHPTHELRTLPEAMTDPFASFASRLRATLDSFRFVGADPRSLLDWAVSQTGLVDPLTRYTRHELEEGYAGFVRQRDQHLTQLIQQIKKSGDAALLDRLLKEAPSHAARQALRKAMRG